jgi:Domain of unknown function (DUF4412)
MKKTLFIICTILLMLSFTALAQTNLTIKKKSSMSFPGMPAMPKLPAGMKNPMDALENRKSTVYIKGSRMRTDMFVDQKDGKAPTIFTSIFQSDKKQMISYSNKKKKYYVDPIVPPTSASVKNSKKGGVVTVTGSVTDTGERAKLFGFNARHLKETITMTPSKNACTKQTIQVEIEGWYAEYDEFLCPITRNKQEFMTDKNCFDDFDFQTKGGIAGIALKEIKKMTMQGMAIVMEEEVTEILKTPLADSLFEPPTGYKAANTLKEVEDDSADDSSSTNVTTPKSKAPSNNPSPTFALPQAGIEKSGSTAKKTNIIRIGVAKPKVTTPDSKKDPNAGDDIASAVTNSLIESLKAENVEGVELETDSPETEAKEKGCDYIFYANITQKRGGGMFGKVISIGAMTASVFVPGIGGMIATTAASQVMNQTMGKTAKAKDEFTFDYKVVGLDKSVFSQAVTKSKTEKDGEDVVTPQIRQAAKSVLEKVKK